MDLILLILAVVFGKSLGANILDDVLVEWYAPLSSGGGYCSEALAIIAALRRVNVSVVGKHHGDSASEEFIKSMSPEDRGLLVPPHGRFNVNPNTGRQRKVISVCHSEPGAWNTPYPKFNSLYVCPPPQGVAYTIGRTMFETDRIPSGWPDRLRRLDEIWVPTRFSQEIFAAANVPSVIMPEPVDTEFYHPVFGNNFADTSVDAKAVAALQALGSSSPLFRLAPFIEGRWTIFLFVGKWEKRKGISELLRAYYDEFGNANTEEFEAGAPMGEGGIVKPPKPRVLLLMVTSAYHSSRDFDRLVVEALGDRASTANSHPNDDPSGAGPARMVLTRIPQQQMPLLYSLPRTFLVVPSSGEGWGRPHVEAMSCGKPIIATNWSGPTAFMDETNAFPLPIEEALVAAPGWEGHLWAKVNETELRRTLRRMASATASSSASAPAPATAPAPDSEAGIIHSKGMAARAAMQERYSLEAVGLQLRQRLEDIYRDKLSGGPAVQVQGGKQKGAVGQKIKDQEL